MKPDAPLSDEDVALILGCLDTLGQALTEHNHSWSPGERAIYEEACSILGKPSAEGEEWQDS